MSIFLSETEFEEICKEMRSYLHNKFKIPLRKLPRKKIALIIMGMLKEFDYHVVPDDKVSEYEEAEEKMRRELLRHENILGNLQDIADTLKNTSH